ncbi:MAG: LLM class flavin-dependent oxidoreductase [Chloroflexi bacterium]|nr:LLM class flavin-dependent oxidoreductase [Chloroflexota bacterium]
MYRRLGIALGSASALTRAETIGLTLRAEELGYESAWAGESWGFDAFTTLTELAVRTSTIKLGTHIATIFSRTPGMLAQSAASLDDISGGRLILGLGTSGPKVVRDWHGQAWDRPLRRMREVVEIVRLTLSGERVDYDGKLFKVEGFRLRATVSRQDVPIMIASLGNRSVVQTGEIAEGWLPIFPSTELIKESRALLAQGASLGQRDASAIEIAPTLLAAVSDDEVGVRDMARAHLAFYVGGMGTFYQDLVVRQGFADEAGRIKSAWAEPRREGRVAAAAAVTDEMLDAMTLVGSRASVLERLSAYADAGVTLPILMFPFGADRSMVEQTLDALRPDRQ